MSLRAGLLPGVTTVREPFISCVARLLHLFSVYPLTLSCSRQLLYGSRSDEVCPKLLPVRSITVKLCSAHCQLCSTVLKPRSLIFSLRSKVLTLCSMVLQVRSKVLTQCSVVFHFCSKIAACTPCSCRCAVSFPNRSIIPASALFYCPTPYNLTLHALDRALKAKIRALRSELSNHRFIETANSYPGVVYTKQNPFKQKLLALVVHISSFTYNPSSPP